MTLRTTAVGIAAAVTIAMVVVLVAGSSHSHPITRAQIVAFERAVDPLVSRGGQVVQEGMKPALGDLTHDHVTPPSYIAHEADGWAASLTDVRRQIAAVRTPRQLTAARTSLLAALDLYVSAARTFRQAALATGAQRESLVKDGIAQAQHADTVFDQAARDIQTQRRSLHLSPSIYFPNPQG